MGVQPRSRFRAAYGASSGVVLVEVSGRFCSGSGSGWFRCSSKKVPVQAGAHWLQGSGFDMVPVKVLEIFGGSSDGSV